MPSVSCSFCQTPNLSGAVYCKRCQRPITRGEGTLRPAATAEPKKRAALASRPTEPITLKDPLAPSTAPATPPSVRLKAVTEEVRQNKSSESTQLLDIDSLPAPFMADDTTVGPIAQPVLTRPSLRTSSPHATVEEGPPLPRQAPPKSRLQSLQLGVPSPHPANKADIFPGDVSGVRLAAALAIDAGFCLAVALFWMVAESALFGADWPQEKGDFLWGLAQWLHLHLGIGLRGVFLGSVIAWLHQIVGAHGGQTLGRSLCHTRLARKNDRPLTWVWAFGYATVSFFATLFSGANLYFMVVDKKQRSFSQSIFNASVVLDAPRSAAFSRRDP